MFSNNLGHIFEPYALNSNNNYYICKNCNIITFTNSGESNLLYISLHSNLYDYVTSLKLSCREILIKKLLE